jgi:uncharacterized protein YcbX
MSYSITQLFVYPIKSLAGIAVQSAELCNTGLLHDRRWMLIDEQNKFITQREFHQLCLFKTAFVENGISITYNNDQIIIPLFLAEGTPKNVTIWDDKVDAIQASSDINDWFSKQLNQKVSLVYMPENSKRLVDLKYANNNEIVSFADGYPLLVIGQSSLDLLQSKLQEQITIERFRPNIVFTGGQPHCEDDWKNFSINNIPFKGVKPCGRCVITTINPTTAIAGAEPLKTLAKYRAQENKILFGQNVMGVNTGSIAVGNTIML